MASAPTACARATGSWVSRSPIAQPPPCRTRRPARWYQQRWAASRSEPGSRSGRRNPPSGPLSAGPEAFPGCLQQFDPGACDFDPSAAVKVIGNASSSPLSVGSISGFAVVRSVISLNLRVQRSPQRRESAIQRRRRGRHHAGVGDKAVHHRLGVIHLDGDAAAASSSPYRIPSSRSGS